LRLLIKVMGPGVLLIYKKSANLWRCTMTNFHHGVAGFAAFRWLGSQAM
jgi:hypothetical protein